ncbi:MAG: arylsulfatase [Candidatus Aminicenantes bacterium]|nr:arylsulfatase [Candidatus Aminicenantes bacterium]
MESPVAKIKRREFLETMACGAAALAVPQCRARGGGDDGPPNIVLILADDLGYGDPGCNNPESKIPMPNVNALAKGGVRFTDAHSPSAVCTPTRYGILTGRYAWRTWLKQGVVGGYTPPLIEPGRATAASLLKSRGYATGFFGKWHLGLGWTRMNGFTPTWQDAEKYLKGSSQDADPSTGLNADFSKPVQGGPLDHGYDDAYFTAACSTIDGPFVFIDKNRTDGIPDRQVSEFYDMTKGEEGSPRKGWIAPGYKLEDVDFHFTRRAIAFMERSRAESPDKPFFVSLFLSAPHTPWIPPELVKGKSLDGPRGDLVMLADWCVGEVVTALERLGAAENTLLIFTSDNGPHPGTNGHKSEGPLRGLKSHIWEGGHRIPLVARWPKRIKPGRVSDEPVCLVDLLATFARFAGAGLSKDAGPDSYDISPALLGEKRPKPIREALVSHSQNGTFAIRQGGWKLILDNKTSGGWMTPAGKPPVPGSPGQLYNLAEDPKEQDDLWEKHPEIVARLTALLERYKKDGRSAPRYHGGKP